MPYYLTECPAGNPTCPAGGYVKDSNTFNLTGGTAGGGGDKLERTLRVAVRAASADENAPWCEDLRELSGGQRTLLSVSLLVSCSLHKPSALLAMDEVDAALDDKNVELIAQLLKKLSCHTQVIAISHRAEFQKLASRRIPISAGSQVRKNIVGQ